ncbi:MAG: hypothetical protein E4H23_12645 [Chrysiogenales bacterium]|nr:MAG: hypothetical protein E4H23_12645 [Chrysiogenales bacterium]
MRKTLIPFMCILLVALAACDPYKYPEHKALYDCLFSCTGGNLSKMRSTLTGEIKKWLPPLASQITFKMNQMGMAAVKFRMDPPKVITFKYPPVDGVLTIQSMAEVDIYYNSVKILTASTKKIKKEVYRNRDGPAALSIEGRVHRVQPGKSFEGCWITGFKNTWKQGLTAANWYNNYFWTLVH